MILPVSILFPFPSSAASSCPVVHTFLFSSIDLSTTTTTPPSYLLVKFWFTRRGRRAIKSKLTSRCSIKDNNGAGNNARLHKIVAKTCVNVSTAFSTSAVFLGGKEWRRMPVIFYGNSIKLLELKERKRGRPFFRRFTTPRWWIVVS